MMASTHLTILLVEDNPGDARLITTYLNHDNGRTFTIHLADRVSRAKQIVSEEAPDIILLDLGLPDSQGLDTLHQLLACCDSTPVIVMTGLDDEETALKAIHVGAQDYLPKGRFDEHLLVRTVRYAYERRQAETAIRVSEERYRRLFEQASEAVLIVSNGRIVRSNPASCTLIGYELSDLLGAPFERFLHHEDRDLVILRHGQRLAGEDPPNNYTFRVVRSDRETRWVELSASLIDWDDCAATLNLLTDVTERTQAELQRGKLLARQTTINELTLALGIVTDPQDIYDILRQHVTQIIPTDTLLITSLDRAQELIRPEYAAHNGEVSAARGLTPIPMALAGEELQDRLIRSGEPILINDDLTDLKALEIGRDVEPSESSTTASRQRQHNRIATRSMMQVPMKAEGQVIGIVQLQSAQPGAFDEEDVNLVSGLANVAAIALRNSQLIRESKDQAEKLEAAFEGIVRTVNAAVETRDPYTAGHQQRVACLAAAIAETLGLDRDTIEGVRVAGLVHDIGKLGIPSEILAKPGQLMPIELKIVQTHVECAYQILQPIDFPWPIAEMVFQHHERLDGSGYPRGLSGNEVSLEASILGVADVVEAMASHRPYRPALGLEAALREIEEHKGTRYGPQVVEACVALFRERGYALEPSPTP